MVNKNNDGKEKFKDKVIKRDGHGQIMHIKSLELTYSRPVTYFSGVFLA